MKRLQLIIVLLAVCGMFLGVQAQYTGPGAAAETLTVKQVKDNASKLDKSDKQVKVKGFIVEQVNKDTYWFKDETGKIKVEIGKKHIPTTPFNEKTEVLIWAEVDYDLLEGVELEVERLILK